MISHCACFSAITMDANCSMVPIGACEGWAAGREDGFFVT